MTKRALIRKGDRTTHGGTVLEGDLSFIVEGKPLSRVGDKVHCPRCKGAFPIATGAQTMFSDQYVARHDDVTGCGAKLIASQNASFWESEDGADEMLVGEDSVDQAQVTHEQNQHPEHELTHHSDSDDTYAVRFQSIEPETGLPQPRCVYILTRENGGQHGGITDKNGFTETIVASQSEKIGVHFMFKSSNGENIEREDLS